jgi:hypothetical protein
MSMFNQPTPPPPAYVAPPPPPPMFGEQQAPGQKPRAKGSFQTFLGTGLTPPPGQSGQKTLLGT